MRSMKLRKRDRSRSFKRGTDARASRDLAADRMIAEGMDPSRAYAIGTAQAQRLRGSTVRRMAKRKRIRGTALSRRRTRR